jgi:hypothetical protein
VKILVVSWYMPPYLTMGALRVGKLCKFFHQSGHELRILSCDDLPFPNNLPLEIPEDLILRTDSLDINGFPKAVQKLRLALQGLFAGGSSSVPAVALETGGSSPGIPVSETANDAPARPSLAKRTLRMLRIVYQELLNFPDPQVGWYFSGKRGGGSILAEWQPDVVFASAPPFTTLMVARALCRQRKLPLVVEYRDRFYEDPYASLSNSFRKKIERVVENWWMKDAKAIVTVSEPWAEDYQERFGLPVIPVYNGFDPDDFAADHPRQPTDSNILNIVYTGILYPERRDPSPLFEAMSLCGDAGKNIRVSFYGADRDTLIAMASRHGVLDQIDIHDSIPYQQSIDRQMNADILLLLQWNDPKERGNVPGKVFEYLGSRRPVLGIGVEDGVPARILKERDAGIVVNDPGIIAQHLKSWLAEKQAQGKIDLLPMDARKGLSRPEQFEKVETLLKRVADDAS